MAGIVTVHAYDIMDPTIRTYKAFSPLDDARNLRKAMKGLGTNEDKIILILTKRTPKERVDIALTYKREFSRDLFEDLKSELGGKLEDVILALVVDQAEYLAKELHNAMDRIGTKEDVLTEILCTRGDDEIRKISDAYTKLYDKSLLSEISGEVSGDYKKLLTLLLTTPRSTAPCDFKQVASELYKSGEQRLGTDEEAFIIQLAHQSFHQLSLVFEAYELLSGKTFQQAVENEMSGDFKEAIMTIARRVESLPRYFAERLHDALNGIGTKDKTLIRIIVTRAAIDLGAIKKEYLGMYGSPLEKDVKSDTSGDYEKALVSILEGN